MYSGRKGESLAGFEVKQDWLGERIPVLALASTGHDSLGKSGNQFVLLVLGVRCHGWIGVFQKSILTPVGLYDNQIKQFFINFSVSTESVMAPWLMFHFHIVYSQFAPGANPGPQVRLKMRASGTGRDG